MRLGFIVKQSDAAALAIANLHALFAGHLAIAAQLMALIAASHTGYTTAMGLFGSALAYLILVLEVFGSNNTRLARRLLLQGAMNVLNADRLIGRSKQLGRDFGDLLGAGRRHRLLFLLLRRSAFLLQRRRRDGHNGPGAGSAILRPPLTGPRPISVQITDAGRFGDDGLGRDTGRFRRRRRFRSLLFMVWRRPRR